MYENLVIVESPAKAKTIEKFLGKDFHVTSSMGHIRDLEKKDFGIDIQNDFTPKYEISADKKKIVAELRKLSKESNMVWLASDEDREGEAISWHLMETLGLKPEKTKRIVFHEITKEAILKAIQNPRPLDINLVNAQQARRVLDRIVGFEVSPVLWKKVKPSLSAGRVQSVAVRFIVEREREIHNFTSTSAFRVSASFLVPENDGRISELKAELNKRFDTKDEAYAFLEKCKEAEFQISDVVKKPGRRSPAPPFITSTLQQEASRKLGFSVSQTMSVAQKLYESGKITYMRTDSVTLSDMAIGTAKQKIISMLGEKYHQFRQYKNKSKGAQEAHEAIRPTYIDNEEISGTNQEKKLYDLIWKRTIASQMAEAELEKTTVTIDISTVPEKFVASGEVLIFDGFLVVYIESDDEEDQNGGTKGLLPPMTVNQILRADKIHATERFTLKPPRYTEASLVKKLEEQGIGRPSTYAPIITTVQNRGYVVKEDRAGTERPFTELILAGKKITEKYKTEQTGAEKSKLFPTDIGMVVTDFLMKYFDLIMDYNFTAKVELEFDEIAEGQLVWNEMMRSFYDPFHAKVEGALAEAERANGVRILGIDPTSGKELSVRIGRFGPVAQLGEVVEDGEKPLFASLRVGQHLETITIEEALELFKLPRTVGEYEGKPVAVAIGRFGPYVRHNSIFVSLEKDIDDPYTVELDRAIELIEAKREKDKNAVIKVFDENPEVRLLNGRWGPYISFKKNNYKIPKTTDATKLTLDDCLQLIEKQPAAKKSRKK
ncbi:MAG: type I DNA topoisomerase [Prolixibacteraceae bacterium]|nr:type I DNA topoisomerase [Prolixibacteraceae bacterium]